MARADILAVTAGDTLGEVYAGKVIDNRDSVRRTFSCALAAAYAARLAHLHDLRALVLVGAGDDNILLLGDHGDNALRAGVGTGAAADALVAVDLCNTVYDLHRAELTGFHTVAHAYTGVGAELIALPAEQHRRTAVLRAGIVEALFRDAFTAGAADKRGHFLHCIRRNAHDLRYLLRRFLAAGDTFVGGSLSRGNGGGIAVASGVSAAAAVSAGKAGTDGFLFRVYLNMEYFRCKGKERTEKTAESTKNEDSVKNFYHFFLLPLRKSSCR